LAGGCAGPAAPTPTPPSSPARPVAPPTPVPAAADKRFIIAPELAGVLHVVNVIVNRPHDSYLKIQVIVQNMTQQRQKFSYHITWFDADGTKLQQEDEGFVPWMLLPNEVSPISVVAPTMSVADFGIAFVPAEK
jgi:hypothetical protein